MPILLLGIFDKDVEAETVQHRFHSLYYVGLEKRDLNVKQMAKGFLQACLDGDVERINALARARCNTAATDGEGRTALMLASFAT